MRSNFRVLAVAVVGLLAVPQFAAASDDVDEQLRSMNERMQALEQQLDATKDELDASKSQVERQQDLIQKAGLEREGSSGLSGFFTDIEIGGWVAASWFWNFNQTRNTGSGDGEAIPGGLGPNGFIINDQNLSQAAGGVGTNTGFSGLFNPFHPDHNSFSLDQLWFEIEKPVTEESRGGFRADMAYGKTASILSSGSNRLWGGGGQSAQDPACELDDFDDDDCRWRGDSANDFALYQAYVQYLMPGLEAKLQAGKWETLLGVEVPGTIYNLNITRGFVWTALQPVNHYGILVDKQFENGMNFAIGAANDATGIDPDFNNGKHLITQLGYGAETYSGAISLLWGPENLNDTGGENGVLDFKFQVDPSERFTAYVNADYGWTSDNEEGWGVALAGRVAITDRAGFAVRGEWAKDRNNYFGFSSNEGFEIDNTVVWTLTGTFDYALTDNLMVRAEVRWDTVDKSPGADDEFIKKGAEGDIDDDFQANFTNKDQVIGGVEIVYEF